MKQNLKAALTLASQGFVIFPADPKTKAPVPGFKWKDLASDDAQTIKGWWRQWPDAIPALPTGARNGVSVVDLDQRGDKDGAATYRALGLDPDSAALIVRTGGGGLHLYFDHADGVRNTQGNTERPGLDVRGESGYVIAPGAISAAGPYTITKGTLADASIIGFGPFPAALRRAKVKTPEPVTPAGPIDWPELKAALFTIPNDGHYGEWVQVLMGLHHASGGSAMGLDLARAWSSDYPGYDRKALAEKWLSFGKQTDSEPVTAATILELARHYGRAAITADSFDDDSEPESDPGEQPLLRFLSPAECLALPPRDYIVKGLIAPGQVGCIFGEPGAGKSVIAPRLAYAVAQGEEVFGLRTKQGPVFYVAAEDESGMAARIAALHTEHGAAPDLKLVTGVSDLFSPGTVKGKGSPHLEALRAAVKRERPRLVLIDTLAMAMPGLEENDAAGMARVIAIGRALARQGAAVVFIHHGTKAEGTTPRGHSVFNGALDFSIMVKPADQHGIVRGAVKKNRNGPPDLDIAFRIGSRVVGVDIDGDDVSAPTCEPCTSAEAMEGPRLKPTEKDALQHLAEMIGEAPDIGEPEWRKAATESLQISASEKADNRRRVVAAALKGLINHGLVSARDGRLSLSSPSFSPAWFDDDTGGRYADLI